MNLLMTWLGLFLGISQLGGWIGATSTPVATTYTVMGTVTTPIYYNDEGECELPESEAGSYPVVEHSGTLEHPWDFPSSPVAYQGRRPPRHYDDDDDDIYIAYSNFIEFHQLLQTHYNYLLSNPSQ